VLIYVALLKEMRFCHFLVGDFHVLFYFLSRCSHLNDLQEAGTEPQDPNDGGMEGYECKDNPSGIFVGLSEIYMQLY